MKKKGSNLIFISQIARDGKSVKLIEDPSLVSHVQDTTFTLFSLSITQSTYIAQDFNSYIVKLKETNG